MACVYLLFLVTVKKGTLSLVFTHSAPVTLFARLRILIAFLPSVPAGARAETAAGCHSAVCPRSVPGKTTLPAVAAQRTQLLRSEQGKRDFGCVFVGGKWSLGLVVHRGVRKTPFRGSGVLTQSRSLCCCLCCGSFCCGPVRAAPAPVGSEPAASCSEILQHGCHC